MDMPVLIEQCNLGVPQQVVEALIQVESAGSPHALGVNVTTGKPQPVFEPPQSKAEAVLLAVDLVSQGYNVDVGLMQVNSSNLARYDIPLSQAFEPCRNIEAGSRVYLEFAARFAKQGHLFPTAYDRMIATLSAYNTGSARNGVRNGYVARVMNQIGSLADPAAASMEVNFIFDVSAPGDDRMAVDFTSREPIPFVNTVLVIKDN
ncbi:MAG: lytic transglycosylase domain-containing protein [Sedimenticola sp.]